ncbi:DUF2243 domain-containing protein [Belnapia rosea]|uniref:Uncharacterized membrane protein n=1 Tax=Belnapia rosea TaxID=938405 RepID=A0A1G6ZPU0_9PROT|nr:DUF2243 domain-containing protein [Belnapia rosea]SDE04698.1 Uncharacterized membrane protein [Belnapia rosea]
MRGRIGWSGGLMGFAFGGFFDGILLHQLLQWHHLLSGWYPGQTLVLERWHMAWDGVFHAIHYLVLALGLALLWPLPSAATGRRFAAAFAIGFGAWHVLDAVVNHWALGLHRIREGVDQPLLYDLAFFALGLAAIGLGLLWRERGPRLPPGSLALLALSAGLGAALPARGPSFVALALPGPEAALRLAATAQLAGADAAGDVWVFATPDPAGFRRTALALGAHPAPLPALPGLCLTRL